MVDIKATLPIIISTLLILVSAYFIMRDVTVVKQAVLRLSPEPLENTRTQPTPDAPAPDKKPVQA